MNDQLQNDITWERKVKQTEGEGVGQDSLAAPSRCSSPTRLPVNQTSAASDDMLLFLVQPVTLGEAGGSPQGPNIAQVQVILMVRCGQLLLKDVSEVALRRTYAVSEGMRVCFNT